MADVIQQSTTTLALPMQIIWRYNAYFDDQLAKNMNVFIHFNISPTAVKLLLFFSFIFSCFNRLSKSKNISFKKKSKELFRNVISQLVNYFLGMHAEETCDYQYSKWILIH